MARSGFGGSGDYSGFFGSLYNANRAQAEAQQSATDQDTFDRWQNGLIDDQEWLQYIQGRIDALAGRPKDQQKWITNLRKFQNVIADNQAEAAYKDGTTGVGAVIDHYRARLAAMDGASVEARDMQARINDLLDQQASESIQAGGQKIIDEINKGTRSYKDLEAFLKDRLGESRPNSDLRKSLEKQLKDVQETIRTTKLEGSFEKLQYQYDAGSLSGGAYARKLRQMAVQFKDSDPKRYYQILEAAVALEKRGGSGGGGGGGGGRGGGGSRQDLNARVDRLQARRNVVEALLAQYDNGQKVGIHPETGEQVVFNEATVKSLDQQLLGHYDHLAATYTAKGDKSAAANTLKAKARYISTKIVKHNTIAAGEQEQHLLRSTKARLDAAMDDPDPTRAMATIREVARDWNDFSRGLTTSKVVTNSPVGASVQYGGPKGPMDQVDPDYASRATQIASSLQTLSKPGVSDQEAEAALTSAMELWGGDNSAAAVSNILKPVLEVHAREQGLASGDLVRVVTDKGVEYKRTTEVTRSTLMPDGSVSAVRTRVPVLDEEIDPSKGTRLVDVFIDINGQPTKVKAVARQSAVEGMNAWKVKEEIKTQDGFIIPAGTFLTQEQIAKLGKDFEVKVATGAVEGAPVAQYWKVTIPPHTDKNGRTMPAETWAMDGATGLWYKDKLPIRGVQTDAHGMVKVDNSGPMMSWQAFASARGVPAPYAGANAAGMQALMDAGQVDVQNLKGRGITGELTDYQSTDPYYLPALSPAHRDTSWWDEEERGARQQQAMTEWDRKTRELRKTEQDRQLDLERGRSAESDRMTALAKSLGINVGGTKPRQGLQLARARKAEGDRMTALAASFGKGPGSQVPSFDLKEGFRTGPSTVGVNLGLPQKTGPSIPKKVSVKADDRNKPVQPKKATKTPKVTLKPVINKARQAEADRWTAMAKSYAGSSHGK